ncbi:MAG TPA: LLM class flavin-dependent oxidoreductase [Chloroflexota bacterium]|nr:LLM class flavin-dependent oxidoreductase [Chloroflexota bacterium]
MRIHANMLATYFPDRNGTPEDFYRQIMEQVQLAEELSFDGFWFTEHHFIQYGGSVPNPATMISAAAIKTSRIRLGSCVSILPLHHPLQAAEDYAMADLLSHGRLEFGIGSGNTQKDYDVFQIGRGESRERYEEAAGLIVKAWTNKRFSHAGKFWQMEDVELHPKPLQRPHPPMWVAGTSEAGLGWAGRMGYDIMTVAHPHPPERQRPGVAAWRRGLLEGGHDPRPRHCQLHARIFAGENRERARETAMAAIVRYDTTSRVRGRAPGAEPAACEPDYDWEAMERAGRNIYGTPDDCIEGIKRAQAHYDFDMLSATFNFGGLTHEEVTASMRLFAREVMPAFAGVAAEGAVSV